MQINKENLGNKIKFMRKNKLNITQSELAEKIGISKRFMRDIENGRTYPSFETLSKLSMAFGVSMSDFFTEDELKIKKTIHNEENEIEKVTLINKLIKNLIEEKIITDENNITDDVLELIINTIKIQIKLEKEKLNSKK